MKRVLGALAAALIVWLLSPHLFTEFTSVRLKIVRADLAASSEHLRVPIDSQAALDQLRPPFALITRVRNESTDPLRIRVAVDDREMCSTEIPAGKRARIDCPVTGPWSGTLGHSVLFSTTSSRYAVEYLELATHFGALTPGPRDLIIGPSGFSGARSPSTWRVLLIVVLGVLSAWCVGDRRLPRVVSGIHLALTLVAACVMAIVILAGLVSPYSLIIASDVVERLLVWTALPALVAGAYVVLGRAVALALPPGVAGARAVAAWLAQPRIRRLFAAVGVGLLVGGVYLAFAAQLVAERHGGNVSGLLLVSQRNFDTNPMVNTREDIRRALRFNDGGGYDGQFFYFMAFDPLLVRYRDTPRRYGWYMDGPPYRYGRIGFSLLTNVLAGGRPDRFPITMVALLIAATACCGALLAAIAQHCGQRAWFGLLIVAVPGFRQSIEATVPEPLAIAFFLAAYLCLLRQRWWACGILLGMCLLVRETSGALALAVGIGLLFTGQRRAAAIVTLLAFLPIVMWKGFVGWVFWPAFGIHGLTPHPDDLDAPFAGIRQLWTTISRGRYWGGGWEMARAGIAFSSLAVSGGALALVAAVKRPTAIGAAAVFYALLTLTFNYKAVWIHPGNAQRLTIDLFVALALIYVHISGRGRVLPWTFSLFWYGAAWYVFFGSFDASIFREAVFKRILSAF